MNPILLPRLVLHLLMTPLTLGVAAGLVILGAAFALRDGEIETARGCLCGLCGRGRR